MNCQPEFRTPHAMRHTPFKSWARCSDPSSAEVDASDEPGDGEVRCWSYLFAKKSGEEANRLQAMPRTCSKLGARIAAATGPDIPRRALTCCRVASIPRQPQRRRHNRMIGPEMQRSRRMEGSG